MKIHRIITYMYSVCLSFLQSEFRRNYGWVVYNFCITNITKWEINFESCHFPIRDSKKSITSTHTMKLYVENQSMIDMTPPELGRAC